MLQNLICQVLRVTLQNRPEGILITPEKYRSPYPFETPALSAEHARSEQVPFNGIRRFMEAAEVRKHAAGDPAGDPAGHVAGAADDADSETVMPPVNDRDR